MKAYTQSELKETAKTIAHFRQRAKFLGFFGSSGPSQSAVIITDGLLTPPTVLSLDEFEADNDIAGPRHVY